MELDAVIQFDMPEDHALGYQLCLVWIELSQKAFPDYKHSRLPKKGDPRKCLLFKYCLKLVQETKGIVPFEEYPLYIRAQLDILKAITDGVQHPQVDPNILVGPKSWIRWRIWKKKYDARLKAITGVKIDAPVEKIKRALEETKAHLVKHFHGLPTYEQMEQARDNKNILRWFASKQISPYYVVMSPFIATLYPAYKDLEVSIDLDVYKEQVTESTLDMFQGIFPNESTQENSQ